MKGQALWNSQYQSQSEFCPTEKYCHLLLTTAQRYKLSVSSESRRINVSPLDPSASKKMTWFFFAGKQSSQVILWLRKLLHVPFMTQFRCSNSTTTKTYLRKWAFDSENNSSVWFCQTFYCQRLVPPFYSLSPQKSHLLFIKCCVFLDPHCRFVARFHWVVLFRIVVMWGEQRTCMFTVFQTWNG